MSSTRSLIVKNQFARYKRIRDSIKYLENNHLVLIEKKGDSRYEACEESLANPDEKLTLRCDVKKEVLRSLHIQLFCKDLQEDACYRFESCGSPHTNRSGPLKGRRVPTPHFHEYDENGRVLAYQTAELLDTKRDLLGSRDDVLLHFCNVHNIHVKAPLKLFQATLFPPEDVEIDVLGRVPFNE